MPLPFKPIVDLYAPTSPGSLMRAICIMKSGVWRISRRASELYSVQIVSSGAWGRARVMDGDGRVLWFQPSTFTGSFWLTAGAYHGLVVELDAAEVAPNLTLNWREQDIRMV